MSRVTYYSWPKQQSSVVGISGFMGVYSQMPDAWQLDREAFVAALPPGVLASSAVQMVLFAGILLLLGLVVMLALSVLASLLIYGNFELRRVRDGFAARQAPSVQAT